MLDATHIANLAEQRGDVVINRNPHTLEGAETITNREFEKVKQEAVTAVEHKRSCYDNYCWAAKVGSDLAKLTYY